MSPAYALEWRSVLLGFAPAVRAAVRQLVEENSALLAAHFYQAMLDDGSAHGFLSHDKVQMHLQPSMQRWLKDAYQLDPDADLEALAQRQVKIGEIHARIDLPVYLVLRGAARIKEGMHGLLLQRSDLTLQEQLAAGQLIMGVMDMAMEIMAQAYATSRERSSRSREAYRLFALTQNVATLRERRRAELLEWQNQCLYAHAVGTWAAMPRLSSSDFGLWFRHKGTHVFQGMAEAEQVMAAMTQIDQVLLPAFAQAVPAQTMDLLNALREQARGILLNLETLFEYSGQMDAGRDALTHLLNRKFLSVVLSKEVALAREHHTVFSVLTLDIDHFKQINDRWGHAGGDAILQQVAAMLSNNSRGGDYVFRLGGEEFLLLLVDTGSMAALHVAEKLRTYVEGARFGVPGDEEVALTVSIGVATFDGHPDYQRVLRRSDEALYAAKTQGRNRVVVENAMEAA